MKQKMFSVGLTGGIGSGKSYVAELFRLWGAAIVDTDAIAHALTAAGGAAIDPIRAAFGARMITDDGALDRKAMRDLVFGDPGARTRLEAIVHPMITSVTQQQTHDAKGCYLVFVVPLLVESGRWHDRVDRICVVDCDAPTQVDRVRARDGLTPDAIARIMSVQASREARLAVADDVLFNGNGTSPNQLERHARLLHDAWCIQASQRPVA